MKVFKTCFEGVFCVHDDLEKAKEMMLIDIECDPEISTEEFEQEQKRIINLTENELPYEFKGYSLIVDEMTQEEYGNLPEFEGY